MIRHEIGDVVEVVDHDSFWYESIGIVEKFNEDLYYNVFVRFDDGSICNYLHKELRAV
jgi:hypothetical protein